MNGFTVTSCHLRMSYLVVFTQVSPHTGAVSAAHQHVVNKEVNSRYGAGEFPSRRVVVVSNICDYVVEFQNLISLVLLLQSCIKRNLWDRVVSRSADCTSGSIGSWCSRWTRWSRKPSLTWRTSWSRWSGFAHRTPRTHPPRAARLSLRTLDERRKRLNQPVVFDCVGRLGRGGGRCPLGVAHHLTGPEHLVSRRTPGGVHHHWDQNHQQQHQRDATNTSCDHLRSADSRRSPEPVVFQPAWWWDFCRGEEISSIHLCDVQQLQETESPGYGSA